MKQPSSRVNKSRSLSTRLLAVVIAILATVVFFLTVSSIVLLKRDKIAYVYDSQATACALAGREFAAYAQSALDLVRYGLLRVDPLTPASPARDEALRQLQSVVDNQSVVVSFQSGRYQPASRQFVPGLKIQRAESARAAGLVDSDLALPPEVLEAYAANLAAERKAFVNLSRVGKPALLGILMLDRQIQPGADVGLAFGVVALKGMQQGGSSGVGSLSIFNGNGDILFDSDSAVLFGQALGKGSSAKSPLFTEALASKASSGAHQLNLAGVDHLTSFYKPGLGIVVSTRTELASAMQTTYTLIEKLVFFGLAAIALATVFALYFAKTLTRPLVRIAEATREVADGNFDLQLDEKSQDEVGALAGAVNLMSRRIGELVRKMGDQARMEQELAVASTVQANLFPLSNYGDQQIRLKGYYKSASECGGDWWGFFRIGNRMAIVIADATGHGIPSALMTAAIRGAFSTIHKLFSSKPDLLKMTPREIIPLANAAVFESGRSGINMTFFIGIIDFDTRQMVYANAAHCPPWVLKQEPGKPTKARLLNSAGPRLGEGADIEHVQEYTVDLKAGDMILFYTDGLLEDKSPAGQMYGKKRARKVIEASAGRGEEYMIDALVKDFMAFNGDKPLDDDLTLVAAQLTADF